MIKLTTLSKFWLTFRCSSQSVISNVTRTDLKSFNQELKIQRRLTDQSVNNVSEKMCMESSWTNLFYCPGIFPEGLRTRMKQLRWTEGLRAQIWNHYLHITSEYKKDEI